MAGTRVGDSESSFIAVIDVAHCCTYLTLSTTISTILIPVTFLWVPNLRDILGKENVDKVAKQALSLLSIPASILPVHSDQDE